jgi:excisionase family DNA binding protein
MASPDLSTWLTKADAAARLGLSERTLDRLVAAGKGPECRDRRRPGKRPEPVYNPRDLDVLAGAAAARPAVIAAASPIGQPQLDVQRAIDAEGIMWGEIPRPLGVVLRVIEQLAQITRHPEPAAASPPWLTMREAAKYSGLSESLLRRLARSGELFSVRDGARKVRRHDLDKLEVLARLAAASLKPGV